jgi:nicotinamide-nucleotide amidase
MKSFREAIGLLITVGDELLLGDIPNGNSHHIACELRAGGFRLGRMETVGDAEEEIVRALQDGLGRFQFVIVTGGLGPTDDDRTSEAASKVFNRPLELNVEYEMRLKEYVASRGRKWSEAVSRMAMMPEGASKLVGSTPMAGFFLEHQGIPWYFLPGVPFEMKELLAQWVIPDLEQRYPNHAVYLKRILRVQGLPESVIGSRLQELAGNETEAAIGYLPQLCENWVTLFTAAESGEEAARRVERTAREVVARLGAECVSGEGDEDIETTIGLQLRRKGWKLALAESCTGGLLSRRVTSVAGASDYFDRAFITYSNAAKTELLGVPEDLLLAYGAVSEPVAAAMAKGARERAKVDVALSITGIAGPGGGSPEKPVGTVFIACATPQGTTVEKHLFAGSRERIQEGSAHAALVLLWRKAAL